MGNGGPPNSQPVPRALSHPVASASLRFIPSFNGPTPSSLSTVVAALAVPENPPPSSMLATTASPRKRSPGRMDGTYLPSRLRA
jgi:hypothetical protein